MIRHLLHTRQDRWKTTDVFGHNILQRCTRCPKTRVRFP